MYGYIYKFTNTLNNKIYVGKHKFEVNCLDENYWGSGKIWTNVLNCVPKQFIQREIIDTAETLSELNGKEKYWISALNATDSNIGYNISVGGDGGDITSNFSWYNDGVSDFYFLKSDTVPSYMIKGRVKTTYDSTGNVWINNGVSQKHLSKEDALSLIATDDSWVYGMLDRGIEWQSKIGRYERTPEIIKQQTEGKRKLYKEHPERRSSTIWVKGQDAHNKGKKSITNGVKNKYINVDDFYKWEPYGWYWGNVQNHKSKLDQKDLQDVRKF